MNLNVITPDDATKAVNAVKADPSPADEITDETKPTPAGTAPQVTADDLYSRLLKYIPAPLIGIYLFVINAIYAATNEGEQPSELLLWIVFVFFLAATVGWLIKRKVVRVPQIGVSVLAFAAYATATPGPFQLIDGWDSLYATLAIAAVAVGLIVFQPGPLPEDGE
jgi:FtsH-binding integral membrane protein